MRVTVGDVLNLFALDPLDPDSFRGTQLDGPNHHIVGGNIAAQGLMAAGLTVPRRPPHSLHVYFLRRGDARVPVDFDIARLRDGGTFSVREVTATQDGEVLMQGLASFTANVPGADYHDAMPDVPTPESLVPVEEQLAPYAAEFGGWWVGDRPFDTRYIDPPPRAAMDADEPARPVSRIWLRSRGEIPLDPLLNSCVLTQLSALTMVEAVRGPMHKTPLDVSASLDHTVWFHRPADFSDWLYFEQSSPSGIGGRALATGTFYNRCGVLVCTATQEFYFPTAR